MAPPGVTLTTMLRTGGSPASKKLVGASIAGFRYRERARQWLDEKFFREEYDARKILLSLASLVRFETDPGELAGQVRTLVVGVEALKARKLEGWRERAKGTRIFNHYGPTETTVWATVAECSAEEPGATVPIGRPTPGARVHVLDVAMAPVPVPRSTRC